MVQPDLFPSLNSCCQKILAGVIYLKKLDQGLKFPRPSSDRFLKLASKRKLQALLSEEDGLRKVINQSLKLFLSCFRFFNFERKKTLTKQLNQRGRLWVCG